MNNKEYKARVLNKTIVLYFIPKNTQQAYYKGLDTYNCLKWDLQLFLKHGYKIQFEKIAGGHIVGFILNKSSTSNI